MQATKLAFLLSRETESGGGDTFYQFIPYRYGPFSFQLYHESEKLIKGGCLRESDENAWSVTNKGMTQADALQDRIKEEVSFITDRYALFPVSRLLSYVYERYPWFTVISKASKPRQAMPVAEPAVYTVGYEGISVDGLFNHLLEKGIRKVLDVRRNPVARRYGFHKRTLASICEKLEIDYEHLPPLGIDSAKRKTLKTRDDYMLLLEEYENSTLIQERDLLNDVSSIMVHTPSSLLCMEADPDICHRSRIASMVSAFTSMPVCHLRP